MPMVDGATDASASANAKAPSQGQVKWGGLSGATTTPPPKPRGLLVCFSFAFKEGQDLRPDAFSPEGLTPSRVFE